MFSDLKDKKIKNYLVTTSIFFAILINLMYVIKNIDNFLIYYYQPYVYSIIFMIILLVLFWKMRVFSAGDSKLLIAFCFLIPPSMISNSFFGYFYHLTLLINILYISFLYFFVVLIRRFDKKLIFTQIKRIFTFKTILMLFLFSFSFRTIYTIISLIFPNYFFNYFFLMFVFFIFYQLIAFSVGKDNLLYVLIALSIYQVVSDFNTTFSFEFLYLNLIITLFLILISIMLISFGYQVLTIKKTITELKIGDTLAEKFTYFKDPKNQKISVSITPSILLTIFQGFERVFIRNKNDFLRDYINYDENIGLTKENIFNFKKYYKQKILVFNKFRVYETMPYAIIIVIGVFLTILTKSDLLFYVLSFIF